MAIICIDAGHGGHDPGSIGKRSNEKTHMLNIALHMKPLLEKSGHKVILTRSTDTYLTLSQRAQIANRNKADIFVSLHNNSATGTTATGFETFIFNGNVSNNTRKLQNNVHDTIIKGLNLRDRGKKRANFGVLRESHMPAVLIEYAFINNPNDEAILINDWRKLAQLTVDGINLYFGIKTNSVPSQPKPQPTPSRANNLTKTQLDDVRKALKTAYESGDFFTDHSKNVENMSREQIEDLILFNLVTRDYINRKGK
mgnify:CR=1 FL=1